LTNQYSGLDRILHRIAFASKGLQVALADLEDRTFAAQLANVSIDKPVFITALPRAGTTILLNLLYGTGEFATHTYRSMPFVLCPMIWSRFSRTLRSRHADSMERAHGDGISISVSSPEAFEEIIWHQFWRSHYEKDRIAPWSDRRRPDFDRFLKNHICKQLLLSNANKTLRYLSKNNLNIARLKYIESVFPDATIVVLFRSPLQHASSLLKQHVNFLASHQEDKFSRQYMLGIGHFDFGENFLPVNFSNWLLRDRRQDATTLEFWLEYWIAAYEHVLRSAGSGVIFVSFEKMTQHAEQVLGGLSSALALENPESLHGQHNALRKPMPHSTDASEVPGELISKASTLFDKLIARTDKGL
jgi:hypothetical protein